MLPVRSARGYEVYAQGMEAGAADKARLLAHVRPGIIAELGCGSGAVLELLRRGFPDSQLMGVDLSPEMVERCRRRFPGLEIRRHDLTLPLFDDGTVDTIVLCSILHEVYSYNGYDPGAVRRTLRACADALKKGGRLVIRDGLKPARDDHVYLTPLRREIYGKFVRFAAEFGRAGLGYEVVDGRIRVLRAGAMEFLTKYFYDVNWTHEVREQFGVFTLANWVAELRAAGLRVVHKESYLLDWLRTERWEKDVRLEVHGPSGYRPTGWPHSTMLIAGEK
jgi:SAM-dependent methyltransferase